MTTPDPDVLVDLAEAERLLAELESAPADRITDVRRWQEQQELLREEVRDLRRALGEAA